MQSQFTEAATVAEQKRCFSNLPAVQPMIKSRRQVRENVSTEMHIEQAVEQSQRQVCEIKLIPARRPAAQPIVQPAKQCDEWPTLQMFRRNALAY
jgi:hypothetical protein